MPCVPAVSPQCPRRVPAVSVSLSPLGARGAGARTAQRPLAARRGGAGGTCRESPAVDPCPASRENPSLTHRPDTSSAAQTPRSKAWRTASARAAAGTPEHLSLSSKAVRDSPCPGRLVAEPPTPPGGTFNRFPFHGDELSQPLTKDNSAAHCSQEGLLLRSDCSLLPAVLLSFCLCACTVWCSMTLSCLQHFNDNNKKIQTLKYFLKVPPENFPSFRASPLAKAK